MKSFTAVVAALLFAGGLAAPVLSEDCDTVLGCGTDLEWALEMERMIDHHLWDGQIYEIDYAPGAPRTAENIVSVNHYGDSALWTGTYLASQSYRYVLAKKKIAELTPQLPLPEPPVACKTLPKPDRKLCKTGELPPPPPDPIEEEIAFWEAQQVEAKSRIDKMVAKYEVLVNISREWNHEFQPSTEQAGFGGGLIAGEPGYLMRACISEDEPEYRRWSNADLGPDPAGLPRPYTKHRRVYGPLEWVSKNEDGTSTTTRYFCEDGTSRDAYAGATFGLQTAFDLVGPDDDDLRTQVANDLVTLSNFAFKYLWNTPRPHGRISLPVDEAGLSCDDVNAVLRVCGHDFENFASPLFVITPMARMNMTVGAEHVARLTGHPDATKWQAILAEEVATQGPMLALSMEFDAMQPYDSYYKHNLSHLIGYNLGMRASSPELRTLFMQAVGAMDNSTGDDVNAHFEAITYALTGEQQRLDAAVTHLRQWRDYRTRIEANAQTNNEQFCGQPYPGPTDPPLECVNSDQLEIVPQGTDTPIVIFPGTSGRRSRFPLPVANRPPTDFLWQRPPNQLNGGESLNHRFPGLDYLVPYWMIRYHTEVEQPQLQPFPLWPGPAHN